MDNLNIDGVIQNDVIYIKKNRKPFIFLIVAILIIALVSGLAYLFIKGNGNLTYRQAERNMIISMAGNVAQTENEYNAADFIFTLTPSESFFSGVNPSVLKGGFIIDNESLYGELAYLNGNKTIISVMEYFKDNIIYFGFPNISDYVFSKDIIEESDETEWVELNKTAAYKTFDIILDKYFELTENEAVEKDVEVILDDITKRCDRYTVVINEEILKQFLTFTGNTLLDNQNLIDYISCLFNANAGKYIHELLTTLESGEYESSPDFKIVMDAYICGSDIVKRDINIYNDGEEINFIITDFKDGNKYAQMVSLTFEDDNFNSIVYENIGKIENNKESGKASFILSNTNNDLSCYTLNFEYTDLYTDKNGLCSGIFVLEVPEAGITFNFTSETNGDTITVNGTLKASYEHIFDIDIILECFKDKQINFNGKNIFSFDDYEKTEEFSEKLSEYFYDYESAFADENGDYDIIGYVINIFTSPFFSGFSDFGFNSDILDGADRLL